MFTYVPNPVTDECEKLTIFVPHVEIQPATKIALIGYPYTPAETLGEFGYFEYFKQRWAEEKTFISIEQDIVVYPGALKAIWDCPEELCVYDFHLPCHWDRNLEEEKVGLPIGCIKISEEVIKKTKDHWNVEPVLPYEVDLHFTKIVGKGVKVHQHHPGVVNANLALLKGEE